MPARTDVERESPDAARVFVFAGPTLATSERARALVRPYTLKRPIRRQDLPRLLETESEGPPGVLVIVDGVFHDNLAVGQQATYSSTGSPAAFQSSIPPA